MTKKEAIAVLTNRKRLRREIKNLEKKLWTGSIKREERGAAREKLVHLRVEQGKVYNQSLEAFNVVLKP